MVRTSNLSIVLVRPAGELNVGSVARAMMNTGFENLVLVGDREFRTPDAFRMAVSAKPIVENAKRVKYLHEALADAQAVFAATARARHKRPRLSPEEAARKVRTFLEEGRRIAIVFGPEDHGLSSDEVDACEHLIGIPSHGDLTSYNLAQAVLLVCHPIFTHLAGESLEEKSEAVAATYEDRRRIETRLLDLLKTTEYLTENREEIVRDMLKRLVFRPDLETRDVRNILAIIRHLDFVIRTKEK